MLRHPSSGRSLRLPLHVVVVLSCAAIIALLLAACSDGGDGDENTAPPPTGVPSGAEPVETFEFGEEATTGGTSEGTLTAMSCDSGVLLVATETRQVHAELSCDRMPPEDIVANYLGQPAKITLLPADPTLGCPEDAPCGKLFVRSDTAGSLEFTVGRAWLADR
jgi:hypothetical protein